MCKFNLLYSILIICLLACNVSSPNENESMLSRKIDSLSEQVSELQKQMAEKEKQDATDKETVDSIQIDSVGKVSAPKKLITPQQLTPQPTKQKKPLPTPLTVDNDTTFYYYTGSPKRVSVKVTSWINGRRRVIFYNPYGDITYTCNDARLSYTITTHLKKFHSNGAVALIEIHNNPGASMNWSDTDITFSINNEPQWKTIHKKPVESLEEAMQNKFYWDDKKKDWIKQEIVREQPVPVR